MLELLLIGAAPLPPNPLLEPFVTETQQVQIIEQPVEPPKEPTLEEKIATNYYKCDESIQYIRADNAMCIDRPTNRGYESTSNPKSSPTPATPKNAARANAGWFERGQCTWLVWTKRPVGQWNDASDWLWQAKRDGWPTGSEPQAGAIAWKYGHVAFVESLKGDKMLISEANYDYNGSVRTIWVSIDSYTAFIY